MSLLRTEKRIKSLLIALKSCCKWGAFIWILLLTQSVTIFESPKTCKLVTFLFTTNSRIACKAASSALLFVQCLWAYLTWTLNFYEKFKKPPKPPRGGSPWLAPSKKAQGIALFMSRGTNFLALGSFSFDLCSLVHCTTRVVVTSWGISLLLKIDVFQAH